MSNLSQEGACSIAGTEQAGYASKCETCPYRDICRANRKKKGEAMVTMEDLEMIQERMSDVQNIVAILSGKGGVGKSTVTVQLANSLAHMGYQVGVLDLDITGPSIPRMFGVEGMDVLQTMLGWEPVYVTENISVISINFLLEDNNSAVIWRGPRKVGVIKNFVRDVNWGALDFLLIDTPPGTSDEHMAITDFLGSLVTCGIVVTTPQKVSVLDAGREVKFCQKAGIKVCGIVENMSGFVCDNCGTVFDIFSGEKNGVGNLAAKYGLDVLGKVPINIAVRKDEDEGNVVNTEPFKPFLEIAGKIVEWVNLQ